MFFSCFSSFSLLFAMEFEGKACLPAFSTDRTGWPSSVHEGLGGERLASPRSSEARGCASRFVRTATEGWQLSRSENKYLHVYRPLHLYITFSTCTPCREQCFGYPLILRQGEEQGEGVGWQEKERERERERFSDLPLGFSPLAEAAARGEEARGPERQRSIHINGVGAGLVGRAGRAGLVGRGSSQGRGGQGARETHKHSQ